MPASPLARWVLIASVSATNSLAEPPPPLAKEKVLDGLVQPVNLTHAPGDFEHLYIVERYDPAIEGGRITVFNLDTQERGAFLIVPDVAHDSIEQGLLGLAFDPDFQTNRRLFVTYTMASGDVRLERYEAPTATQADTSTATTILDLDQPFKTHNAHWIEFGPHDGYLYFGAGDGGSGNDPGNRASDITDQLLGKMLRLDVSGPDDFPADPNRNYAIPPDNPFVGIEGDDEIFAYGLRNPWSSAFDPLSGDLFIGDVGQNAVEEIDFISASSGGGQFFGWRCYEGSQRSAVSVGCDDAPTGELPIFEYMHSDEPLRCSVVMGEVYRGTAIPGLDGFVFFSDYCSGEFYCFRYESEIITDFTDVSTDIDPEAGGALRQRASNFGKDAFGEIYWTSLLRGDVHKLVPATGIADCNQNGRDDGADIALGSSLDFGGGPLGRPVEGAEFFAATCASCHASDGTGEFGPNIRNKDRTRLASFTNPPTPHPGGDFPLITEQQFADMEAFLSDTGSGARPDGVPDECQALPDCDEDGISDAQELAEGTQTDLDFDGVPDQCQVVRRVEAKLGAAGNPTAVYVTPDARTVYVWQDPVTGLWFDHLIDQRGQSLVEAADAVAFSDPKDERNYVAVTASGGTFLIDPSGHPSGDRNLTEEIPNATAIRRASSAFSSMDDLSFIAGIDEQNHLVLYWQTGQLGSEGQHIWAYTDLTSDHLEPAGIQLPFLVGNLITFTTPWNALYIAGLDEAGNIWAVWWAPGMSLWTATNITNAAGAAPVAGDLTAYVTPWGGINFAALDGEGHVVVTWWTPGMEGAWANNDLTADFDEDALSSGELTSYVTPWGGTNIAGLDEEGNLVIYWWAPGMDEWVVSPLSALVPGAVLPLDSVQGLAAPDGLISLFAFSDEDDLVRYHWQPDGQWEVQNLTEATSP